MGWHLSGISAISRCPLTVAQDGVKGGVTFSERDRFCVDGQRLIATEGEYAADKTLYHTEIQNWTPKLYFKGNLSTF